MPSVVWSGSESVSDAVPPVSGGRVWTCVCGLEFVSKRSLGQHMRHSHPKPEMVCGDVAPRKVVCPCGMKFASVRALGQHRRHRHASEVNETRIRLRAVRRGEWSDDDSDRLLALADQLADSCASRAILWSRLREHFPQRTEEAIKKRLQKLGWDGFKAYTTGCRSYTKCLDYTNCPKPNLISQLPGSPSRVDLRIDSANARCPSLSEELHQSLSCMGTDTAPDCDLLTWRAEILDSVVTGLSDCASTVWDSRELLDLARGLRRGTLSFGEATCFISSHAQKHFPSKWCPPRTSDVGRMPRSKAKIRKSNYAAVQRLYRKNRKDAADCVLSGDWRSAYMHSAALPEGTIEYWKDILGRPSDPDVRPTPVGECDWGLVRPITSDEVRAALKDSRGTAPGLDKMACGELCKVDIRVVTQYLNLLLVTEAAPPSLTRSRVTLIPKCACPKSPSDFRPICVSSIILRVLHKIVARRWRSVLRLKALQVAFQKRDGCLEATTVLETVLREAHDGKRPVTAMLLDVSKAFDSVNRDTLVRTIRMSAAPQPLQRYLERLYNSSVTVLADSTITCQRGVRQGDPLSPLLFIMALDEVLSASKLLDGVALPGGSVDAIAYADDLVLLANTRKQMEERLVKLSECLGESGMRLNASKSRVMQIEKLGKEKAMVLLQDPIRVQGQTIRPLTVDEEVRYLGLNFTWKGRSRVKTTSVLSDYLENVTRAPLKPQQRMEILRFHLIPKLQYALVNGNAHRNTLKSMDIMVRTSVRNWLNLPKDTSLGFFYSGRVDGGLDLKSFETTIPIMQRAKLERLATSPDPIVRALVKSSCVQRDARVAFRPLSVQRRIVTSVEEVRDAWRQVWLGSCDGRDTPRVPVDRCSHGWIDRPERVFPDVYMRGLKLRGGLLRTKVRATRGRAPTPDELRCRGSCGEPESLGHILQRCAVSHDARCARHNRLVRRVATTLRRQGREVLVEPVIPTGKTFCKPDIVFRSGNTAIICDVTVVAGQRLIESWDLKVRKYGSAEIEQAVVKLLRRSEEEVLQVLHAPIVLSYRGMLLQRSGKMLRSFGISNRDLVDLCLLTVVGSLKCYDTYMRGTGQTKLYDS